MEGFYANNANDFDSGSKLTVLLLPDKLKFQQDTETKDLHAFHAPQNYRA